MDAINVIGLLIIAMFFVNALAAYLLVRGVKRANGVIVALNERAFIAVTKTISVGLLSIVSANRVFNWHWPDEAVLGLLLVSLLISSMNSIWWLWLYFTHRFSKDGDVPRYDNPMEK